MSRTKKPKYTPKGFESRGLKYIDANGINRADTSANIYESMLLSDAYRDLKTRQKQLYVLCKAQYYGKRKPAQDYKADELFQGEEYFYLNLESVVNYGLYTRNMRKEFYGDMKALEEHGFIQLVAQGGANGKTKSVYMYIDKWREWND